LDDVAIPSLPDPLRWEGDRADWRIEQDGGLSIEAGPICDRFVDPEGAAPKSNAPCVLFDAPDGPFLFGARVSVQFASTFDAGVLYLEAANDRWAKLCFEYSPQGRAMVVSVVTRGVSDDCNSVTIDGNDVYLRIARREKALAFHYSLDGQRWEMVRHFGLGDVQRLKIGLSAQSPMGQGCRVQFSAIGFEQKLLGDLRSGE
jgi:regulation of enolase protein 1 (concanavalin A-like superfamily)